MALRSSILPLLCLLFSTTLILFITKTEINNESIKTVDTEQKNNTWLEYSNARATTKPSRQFQAYDKFGVPVILEWHKTTITSPEFAELMHKASALGIQAFTGVELQFLKVFPEVVGIEPYFKPFEPLFKDGENTVDWQQVETTMQAVIKNHFIFDTTKFSKEMLDIFAQDICFFVMVKSQTGQLLDFINFLVKPSFDYGTLKVTSIAVEPEMQNRGLAKLLMSSIFAILPETKCIFLCTHITNETALRAYRSWGFIKDENPSQDPHYTFNLNHWMFMEYRSEKNSTLQQVETTLVE